MSVLNLVARPKFLETPIGPNQQCQLAVTTGPSSSKDGWSLTKERRDHGDHELTMQRASMLHSLTPPHFVPYDTRDGLVFKDGMSAIYKKSHIFMGYFFP